MAKLRHMYVTCFFTIGQQDRYVRLQKICFVIPVITFKTTFEVVAPRLWNEVPLAAKKSNCSFDIFDDDFKKEYLFLWSYANC